MKTELTITQTTPTQITPEVQALAETIRIEIETGKERAYLAMEQEKRLIYWNVGKHIKQHLLSNDDREDYGAYVIAQLAKELNLTRGILYQCVQFFEEYPRIVHSNVQLTWSHIRVLLHVPEKQAREAFEQKIIKEKLTVLQLKKLVKCDKSVPNDSLNKILRTRREKPYVYRFKQIKKQTMIDLGFRFYIQSQFVDTENIRPLKTNIIQIEKNNDEYQVINLGRGSVPHYTYKAYVIEVIDGDTLWVNIDLGFNSWTTQKIRLKGINAKELQTEEGQSAKEYIEARLKGCNFIAVRTYWRDKFTRYLADIFYKKRATDFHKLIQEGKFLNQELLDNDLAIKY